MKLFEEIIPHEKCSSPSGKCKIIATSQEWMIQIQSKILKLFKFLNIANELYFAQANSDQILAKIIIYICKDHLWLEYGIETTFMTKTQIPSPETR